MRTERVERATPGWSEVYYDDNDRVVEIREYDEAGNLIQRVYAPPSDPHVKLLVYRFVPFEGEDFRVSFEGASPVEHETPRFRIELGGGGARVEMREHHAVVESARAVVEPTLEAWVIGDALRAGRPEFRFEFESSEVVERAAGLDPPQGEVRHVHHHGLVDGGVMLEGRVSIAVSRGSYPAPPDGFAWTPDVETLWVRWQAYLAGKEPLQSMAYACLTLLERQGGRAAAVTYYGISSKVLGTLGRLSTETGDERTARKLSLRPRPLTGEERSWLEETVKALIRRVGEVAAAGSAASLPELTLADLPDL